METILKSLEIKEELLKPDDFRLSVDFEEIGEIYKL